MLKQHSILFFSFLMVYVSAIHAMDHRLFSSDGGIIIVHSQDVLPLPEAYDLEVICCFTSPKSALGDHPFYCTKFYGGTHKEWVIYPQEWYAKTMIPKRGLYYNISVLIAKRTNTRIHRIIQNITGTWYIGHIYPKQELHIYLLQKEQFRTTDTMGQLAAKLTYCR